MEKKEKNSKLVTKNGRTFVPRSDHDNELVTGIFENKDAPGMSLSFSYADDGVFKDFVLYDGKKATVPRYIARHLNNCVYRDVESETNERGMVIGQKPVMRKRFAFVSEF